MKKVLCLFCTIMVLLLLSVSHAYAISYQQVRDIQAQTDRKWVASYETKYRTVNVNVTIDVPKVSKFPVIKITQAPAFDTDQIANYEKITDNSPGFFTAMSHVEDFDYIMNGMYDDKVKRKEIGTYNNGEYPSLLAEDCPLSYEESLERCYLEVNRLTNVDDDQLTLDQAMVWGPFYTYTGSGDSVRFIDKFKGDGGYTFLLEQTFRGISYEKAVECYLSYWDYMSEMHAPDGRCGYSIFNEDHYDLWLNFGVEIEEVYDDVPICSFNDAKRQIEDVIASGHLINIDKVKLCYIPYSDPKSKDTIWLLPAWYVQGQYVRNAKQEVVAVYAEDGSFAGYEGTEEFSVVVQGNNGDLIDSKDSDKVRRRVPQIVTWNDVPSDKGE